jgi:hypothetical protein
VDKLTKKPQSSLFIACGSRAQAKGAYRMLANKNFNVNEVQACIQGSTAERIAKLDEGATVLLIQDTTDANYNTHKKTIGMGYCDQYDLGVKLHSCIALTTEGTPLGIVTQTAETREEASNKTMSAYEKSKRPIEENESFRWLETIRTSLAAMPKNVNIITICDREGDFYEFYNEAIFLKDKFPKSSFIVRVVNNRVTESGEKLKTLLAGVQSSGTMHTKIPRDSRNGKPARTAELTVTFSPCTFNKPVIRKESHISNQLKFNIVHIVEENPPKGIEPIEWILATDNDVCDFDSAVKIVNYYVQRWKIERFHYVLKSGCQVEKIQERSYSNICPLLFLYSVIALYIMELMLTSRECPQLPCDVFFDDFEWKILYCAANKTQTPPSEPYSMDIAVKYLANISGSILAPSDGDIGVKIIWTGLSALYLLAEFAPFVGQV